MAVQVGQGKKQDCISKVTKAKRLGCSSSVEHLPSKHEVLILKLQQKKKKRKKEKGNIERK
jgi:hypothetical protein